MLDAVAHRGEKTRADTLLVERINELPLHLAVRGDGKAAGTLDRLTVDLPPRRSGSRQRALVAHNGPREAPYELPKLSSPRNVPILTAHQ